MKVLDYHRKSKHGLHAYAPGPGRLDWANQPDPFRVFAGALRLGLPFAADRLKARYNDLRAGRLPDPAPPDIESIGVMFELSLGLSAWKQYGESRWALRCNPSSGNLHPTEAYLLTPCVPGVEAGVYHYVSRDHCLELRAGIADPGWQEGLAGWRVAVALASIHWREAWKYGMRGFRYCQHDCGHAIAALAYAAAALGWRMRLDTACGDRALAALVGLDRAPDFVGAETEVPDCLLWVGPGDEPPETIERLSRLAAAATWQGGANRLSAQHREWPDIDRVQEATRKPSCARTAAWTMAGLRPPAEPALDLAVEHIVRQRRSAVAFDGETGMPAETFYALMDAMLPRPYAAPWLAWPCRPAVHLALFVHRVEGLDPGLYLLLRDAADRQELQAAMRPDWLWRKAGPDHLPLWLLLPADLREAARTVSCHQDIAADSCFSLGMLARFRGVAEEPWRYRRLYWECGMIGQVLYLEAEAAGLRGTGIGCFFDDEVHGLLGLSDSGWQSLYHFTVGRQVDDPRLSTLPPYPPRPGGRPDEQPGG
jgi:SagB-type dehydrogenase family enzyme